MPQSAATRESQTHHDVTARARKAIASWASTLGADDYVRNLSLYANSWRAFVRSCGAPNRDGKSGRAAFDDVVNDFRRYEARNGRSVSRNDRKEFGVLRLLASRSGEVVTRDEC